MSDPVTIIQSATELANQSNVFLTAVQDTLTTMAVVIASASAIASKFPKPDAEASSYLLHTVVNLLAFNFGHATNHSDVEKKD